MPASSHNRQRNNAHATRRHHAPRTPGGPERLVPHTLRAALSVPVLSSSRPPDQRVPCPAPHGSFLARSAPSYQSSAPPSAGSAEERTSRHANAVTRSRSTRGTPRKKNLKRRTHAGGRRPVAVKCAELPYMPLLLTGRHSPPLNTHRATQIGLLISAEAGPPDQSSKDSRWGKPGFRSPASTGTPGPRVCAARGRGRKPGEPGKGCSITGRAANGRRPPQAVHTLFAVPHQVAAGAKRPPRTSCRRNQGEKRMNPVMKVPCQNRPHLLPTGRRSGGQGRVAAG